MRQTWQRYLFYHETLDRIYLEGDLEISGERNCELYRRECKKMQELLRWRRTSQRENNAKEDAQESRTTPNETVNQGTRSEVEYVV